MALNQQELDRFHKFATERIRGGDDKSIYDLLAEWELQQPSSQQIKRNAQAIQESIDDMQAGDLGKPARELIAELRQRGSSIS